MFAIDLPAGDHTIYWKIWVAGGSLSLSAGTLMLEAFEPAGGPSALTGGDNRRRWTDRSDERTG